MRTAFARLQTANEHATSTIIKADPAPPLNPGPLVASASPIGRISQIHASPRNLPMTEAAVLDAALPSLILEQPSDAGAIAALIERAFGPGRYAKAAERLREGNRPLLDISFVARADGDLVGCVRMWPILVGETPAVLLGPLAVDEAWRSRGLGAALLGQACEAARAAGHRLVLLVGDAPYYGPLGFFIAPPGRIVMPGPVDPARMMLRALAPGGADRLAGLARPAGEAMG
jgi:predicted N-acetyltransferase YhbS